MRRDPDAGSGTVLAVGLVGAVVALTSGALAVSSLLVARTVAAGAADSAALAAADAAAGYVAAPPCDAAAEIASAVGVTLVGCAITGTTAVVRVEDRRDALRIPVAARARAGQPDGGAAG